MPPEKLCTVAEVAEVLGVSGRRVRYLAERGRFAHAWRRGLRQWRVPLGDVLVFLDERGRPRPVRPEWSLKEIVEQGRAARAARQARGEPGPAPG